MGDYGRGSGPTNERGGTGDRHRHPNSGEDLGGVETTP